MSVQAVEMFEGYTVIYINSTLNMTLNNLRNSEKKITDYRVGHKSLNIEATASYVFVRQKTNVLLMVS